jgi:DNA-binding NtrC family response regulator
MGKDGSHDTSGELPTVQSQNEKRQLGGVFTLTVVQGPDAGKILAVNAASAARVLVGKSPTCTLQLTDREVSRRHASLRAQDRSLILMDLGSTNHTFVNNVAIREVYLRGGESIRLGSTVINVALGEPSYVSIVQDSSFGRLLGESPAMRVLYPMLHNAAAGAGALLLEGEGGVGKHLAAEEIHARSKRAAKAFVVVACRSLRAEEAEERLFGEGGAVSHAAGGTIYIDEVAALPSFVQERLVGMHDPPPSAPRFVFGTRQDLDREVTAGRFREDLLAALAPVRIELPPLREREGDVALLARAFWANLGPGELPGDFLARAQDYAWPDNVRELASAVHTRFSLGEFGRWREDAVRKVGDDSFHAVLGRELRLSEARDVVVEEFERRYVEYMLERHGSTKDAAKASGVAQRYFQLLRARLKT